MVNEYISEAKGLSISDDQRWVATGSDVNHVITILERCVPQSIEWASRRGLQFVTAKMEAALFTRRQGHRRNQRAKLTATIIIGNRII